VFFFWRFFTHLLKGASSGFKDGSSSGKRSIEKRIRFGTSLWVSSAPRARPRAAMLSCKESSSIRAVDEVEVVSAVLPRSTLQKTSLLQSAPGERGRIEAPADEVIVVFSILPRSTWKKTSFWQSTIWHDEGGGIEVPQLDFRDKWVEFRPGSS